jgi:hypothetical protein
MGLEIRSPSWSAAFLRQPDEADRGRHYLLGGCSVWRSS